MPEHTDPPAEPAVFAYLAGDHPRIIDVLIALSDLGIRTKLYLRDAESSLGRFATRRKLTVHEKPPGFSETMSRTSLVVSHGGGGITHAALLSGRPQIVIPRQTESYGTAIAIEKLNMGRRVMAEHGANAIRAAIAHASGNPALRKNAEALARSAHENFYLQARLQGLLEACNELAYASHGSRRQSKPQRLTSIA
jgi:UDP-N-acetylglucosamine:LPS N-acetylglucosamine transferase